MSNVRTVEPSISPVSVDDFKLFAKISDTAEDTQLDDFIDAAIDHFEQTTGLALIEQTWRLTLDRLPTLAGATEPWWDGIKQGALSELTPARSWIEIPTAPLISVTSFSAFQMDNTSTLFTEFYSDTDGRPGRVLLNSGAVWPVATRNAMKYQIVYKAGFGTAADNVPADIKICVKQLALHFYENRELMTFDTAAVKVPLQCERIMTRRKLKRIA